MGVFELAVPGEIINDGDFSVGFVFWRRLSPYSVAFGAGFRSLVSPFLVG